MRVLQASSDLDLPLEAFEAHGAGELFGKDLHDYTPAERDVFGNEGATHPAAAELTLHSVRAAKRMLKLLAERISHGVEPDRRCDEHTARRKLRKLTEADRTVNGILEK